MTPQITTTILLTRGYHALIDLADYERVSRFSWIAAVHPDGRVYAKAHPLGEGAAARKKVYMHRMVIGAVEGETVDHIDNDSLNNTRSNLRICTNSQNQMNRRPKVSRKYSPYKGVYWNKPRGKYCARIIIGKKETYLGLFGSAEQAARAYDEAARKLFGEFARLNAPGIAR